MQAEVARKVVDFTQQERNRTVRILVTGGAGFIGSALIRHLIGETDAVVCNYDCLTYAANPNSLIGVSHSPRYSMQQHSICDSEALHKAFREFRPTAVMHLAAESHVDRSIDSAEPFITTNIVGTFHLLEVTRLYWNRLDREEKDNFRFLHVSTDEVYGDIADREDSPREDSSYAPSSPYSASKASADHLVRAWHRTYGLPVMITIGSNNFGPYQHAEKLIPSMIQKATRGENLPIYGNGEQTRDWLYVSDHIQALMMVLKDGEIGESYNIATGNHKKNIDVVREICELLEELAPEAKPRGVLHFKELIRFVEDRPGHDKEYSMDTSKIHNTLGWSPKESFHAGLRKTVMWHLSNR